jgi:hypothetical protein
MDLDGTWLANLGGLSGLTSFQWSPGGSWLSVTGTSDRIIRRTAEPTSTTSPARRAGRPTTVGCRSAGPDGTLLVGQGDGTGLTSVGSFPQYVGGHGMVRGSHSPGAATRGPPRPTARIRNATAFPLGGTNNIAWSPDRAALRSPRRTARG